MSDGGVWYVVRRECCGEAPHSPSLALLRQLHRDQHGPPADKLQHHCLLRSSSQALSHWCSEINLRNIRTIQIFFSHKILVLWSKFTRAGNCRPCLTPCICNNIIMVVRLNTGPGPPSPPLPLVRVGWVGLWPAVPTVLYHSSHLSVQVVTAYSSILQKLWLKLTNAIIKKNQSQPMQAGLIRGNYS